MVKLNRYGSVWDRQERIRQNDDKDTIERFLNEFGDRIQDLVAEGQLTPSQYASLIESVNGLISKGEITTADLNKNNFKLDGTFFTSDFIQQLNGAAIDYTNVSPESITTRDLVKQAVTPDRTSFMEISENLFDKDNILQGKSIDTSGSVIDDDVRWLTDYFIKVPSNKRLSITDGSYRVAVYRSDLSFNLRVTSQDGVVDLTGFSEPAYIKLSGSADPNTIMLNAGTSLKSYKPYLDVIRKKHIPTPEFSEIQNIEVTPEHEVHFRKSRNIYNRFDLEKDKSLDSVGFEVEETGRYLTDYIPINPNVDLSTLSDNVFRYGFYDWNKEPVYRGTKTSGATLMEIKNSSTPVYFLRVSPIDWMRNDIMINEGTVTHPYEDFGYTLVSTPQYPITISSDIVPEGTGGGSEGDGTIVPGGDLGMQFVYGDTASYSAGQVSEIANVDNQSVVDIIEISSNGIKSELQIYFKENDGTEYLYDLLSNDGSQSVPNTFENMQLHGSSIVEFAEFDDRNDVYKVYTNNLIFADGFRVVVKNNDTVSKNISVRVVSRQYV